MNDTVTGKMVDPDALSQNPDGDKIVDRFLEAHVDSAPLIEHVRFLSDESGKLLVITTEDEAMATQLQSDLPNTFEDVRLVIAYYSISSIDETNPHLEEIVPQRISSAEEEP